MIEVRLKKTGELVGVYYGKIRNDEKYQTFNKISYLRADLPLKVDRDSDFTVEHVTVKLGYLRHGDNDITVLYVEHENDMCHVRNYLDLDRLVHY